MQSGWKRLTQDFGANLAAPSDGLTGISGRLSRLMSLRVLAVFLYRLAQTAGGVSPVLGSLLKQVNQLLTGADLAWQAQIGSGLVMRHPVGVVVGVPVRAGKNLTLQQGVTLGGNGRSESDPMQFPTLGHNVLVGAGARILGGITVGDDCVIGANAVLTRDLPGGTVAVGIPARPVSSADSVPPNVL